MPTTGVTSRGVASRTTSEGITPPSSLIRTHPPVLIPPSASGFPLAQRVFAGCCQPPSASSGQALLGVGPSRRYLCKSFSTCLDPYPGCSWSALARFFLQDTVLDRTVQCIGLPRVRTGSAASHYSVLTTFPHGPLFRGCSHSLRFRPADLFATQVVPTVCLDVHIAAVAFPSEQLLVCYLPKPRIC